MVIEEIAFYILQRRNYERKKESNSYLQRVSVTQLFNKQEQQQCEAYRTDEILSQVQQTYAAQGDKIGGKI